MAKELVISQTHNESRVVLIENGDILDFLIDRSSPNTQHPSVGNIYLGRVLRVLPGMQSAFIDIGHERAAFLYVDDAYIPTLEEQRDMAKRLAEKEEKEKAEKISQAKMGQTIPDEFSTLSDTVDLKYRPDIKIQDVIKEGDEIVVQIAKEPIATKGPRVTRHITLAGRHVVYMPLIEHVGVSRRIEEEEERERLMGILESIRPDGKGIIARTVAEGQSHKTLKNDYNFLVKIWKDAGKIVEKRKAPSLIYQDLNFIQRSLRDITDEDVTKIIVDNKNNLKMVDKFVNRYLPNFSGKTQLYDKGQPIFEYFNINVEIERALSNKVYLKSGGALNIDQTEALVSIDVNTGKFVGKRSLEETIFKTNLEAVKEIAYQLRVRNCGGIIIIDFIDMEKEEHREQVYSALLEALKKDRAKTNVLPISGLGLVEMTRKRTRDTLSRIMCEPCQYCEGTGRVKTVETVCYEILRELPKFMKKNKAGKISVFAHPEVCANLTSDDFEVIESLEERYGKQLGIRADNSYHVEQYEIFVQEN
ncbi:MAG: Rne/Rng family ribonuclease [Halobacteriovoraceae bacterium]|nr:Rne/Rng family ribonuclease [Halobacteriovoraceae bacterium]|tara:strand:- start:5250 stop:6845 length:1596 start_codon:yes stop_codon:yes gene_type:complete